MTFPARASNKAHLGTLKFAHTSERRALYYEPQEALELRRHIRLSELPDKRFNLVSHRTVALY
jgi:hypothetical protein